MACLRNSCHEKATVRSYCIVDLHLAVSNIKLFGVVKRYGQATTYFRNAVNHIDVFM